MDGETLRQTLRKHNVKMARLASDLGLTAQALNSRFTTKKVSADFLARVAEATGINIVELLGETPIDATLHTDRLVWVPVINYDARAGYEPNDATDTPQFVRQLLPFSREVADIGDFVIPVYGDSMQPRFQNGTAVLIRPSELWREYIDLGAPYVIELTDGQRLLKIVRAADDSDHLTLVSENPNYDPTVIPKSVIQRMYRVIVSVRREAM